MPTMADVRQQWFPLVKGLRSIDPVDRDAFILLRSHAFGQLLLRRM
jgi:hypothetical protein